MTHIIRILLSINQSVNLVSRFLDKLYEQKKHKSKKVEHTKIYMCIMYAILLASVRVYVSNSNNFCINGNSVNNSLEIAKAMQ